MNTVNIFQPFQYMLIASIRPVWLTYLYRHQRITDKWTDHLGELSCKLLYSIMHRCLKTTYYCAELWTRQAVLHALSCIWIKNVLIDTCLSLFYVFVFTFNLCCFDLSSSVPPPDHPVHRFAGRTVTSGSLVLVTVATKEEGAAQLTVNCEKMVIGTMLVKDVLLALTQWRVLAFSASSHQHTSHVLSETHHVRSLSSVLL